MRLFAISLVVGVVVVSSCSRKPSPDRVYEQRKQQAWETCETLAKQHNASLAWRKLIDPNHTSLLVGNPYTIEVQKALTGSGRIVCVGTLHDILQGDNGYTIHLAYGYKFMDLDFPAFPVMFILTCSEEDADRLLRIPIRFNEPKLAFVAEVSVVKKVLFRAAAYDFEWIHGRPFARDSFEVDVEPGRAFVAYGRCLTFKQVD